MNEGSGKKREQKLRKGGGEKEIRKKTKGGNLYRVRKTRGKEINQNKEEDK